MTTKAFKDAKINVTATDKTQAAWSSIQGGMKKVTDTVFSMQSAILSAAGIGGMGMLIKSSMETADELAKTSDRISVTTESLGAMRHAANLAGVENSALDNSLEKLNINLSRAAQGSGAAASSLDELNLSAETLAKMPTDKALGEIADAMKDVENSSDQARIAQDLFGRSGLEMINMLHGGSEALDAAVQEMDALGLSISRVDAAKIEAANDAMYKAQQVIFSIGQTIAIELAPYIEATTNYFLDSAKAAGGWKTEIVGGIESIVMGLGYLLDVVDGLNFAWKATQLAFSEMAVIILQGVEALADPILKLLSYIPGLGVEYEAVMGEITAITDTQIENSRKIMESMDEIAFGERASDKVRDFFAEIQETAQEIAEEVAESVEERREAQANSLQSHLDEMLGYEVSHNEEVVKSKKKALSDLEKFTQMSYVNQTSYVTTEMEKMSRASSQNSKAMFAVNKTAGVANALIGAYQGAAKSMGQYPYPVNIGMAALSLAAGMANVNAIRSVTFDGGGGGSAPAMGGGGGGDVTIPPEDTPGAGPPPEDEGGGNDQDRTDINIGLHGMGYSKEDVRGLIEQINEEISDGVRLRVVTV